MVTKRAECLNCGYSKENIYFEGFRGLAGQSVKGCRKCKFIINFMPAKYGQDVAECPICHNKDLIDYKLRTKDKLKECPACGKKKLNFTITVI